MDEKQSTEQGKLKAIWDQACSRYAANDFRQALYFSELVINANPGFAGSYSLAAVCYLQLGDAGKAEKMSMKFLKKEAHDAQGWNQLGYALLGQEKIKPAQQAFLKATQCNAKFGDAYNNLGQCYQLDNQIDLAIAAFQKAIEVQSQFYPAYNNLGVLYLKDKKYPLAIAAFEKALAINPQYPEAYFNIGNLHLEQKNTAAAESFFNKALIVNPKHVKSLVNLATLYEQQKQLDQAEEMIQKALSIAPNSAEILVNLGNILTQKNQTEQAISAYEAAMKLSPKLLVAKIHAAKCTLSLGDYEKGWAWEEARHQQPKQLAECKRRYTKKAWRGDDVKGKRVLVRVEQGFGDIMQFSRFVPALQAMGAVVILECRPALLRLFEESFSPGVQVISSEAVLPDYDVHVTTMSLAFHCQCRLDSIPTDMPYFTVPKSAQEKYKTLLTPCKTPRVGIVWAGNPNQLNDHNRSSSLSAFAPLFALSGITFFSLQKEISEEDVRLCQQYHVNTDIIQQAQDFADTAAIIEQMDLVISVCTSVAHLTGMLGKPLWVALCFAADWRWLKERSDSPWYPQAKLFRQNAPGNWSSVFNAMHKELPEKLC